MIRINRDICTGCGTCREECFLGCIVMESGKALFRGEKRCITCGHCFARCPVKAIETDRYDNADVLECKKETKLPKTEEMIRMMKLRRSIRSYNKKKPDHTILEQILDAAGYAGTGGNRQQLRYIMVEEERERVIKMASEILGRMAERGGFYGPSYNRIYRENLKGRDELFYDAPILILVVGNRKKAFDVEKDGGLAAAYIQLLCETRGIGTCINGFFGAACREDERLRQMLGIQEEECLIYAMGAGYTDVKYLRSAPRKQKNVVWM